MNASSLRGKVVDAFMVLPHSGSRFLPGAPDEELVSIVVPVYNVETRVYDCLDSIVNQTYRSIQVIIVDDGSTDGSTSVCEDFAAKDDRVLFIRQNNQGVAFARNTGLDYARGLFITFIDGDDWVEPTFVESLLNAALLNGADIAICGYVMVAENGQVLKRAHFQEMLNDEQYYWSTAFSGYGDNLYVWNKLYRGEIIGNSRFTSDIYAEDYAFNLAVFPEAKSVCYIGQELYWYHRRDSSLASQPTSMKNLDAVELNIQAMGYFEAAGYLDCIPGAFHRAVALCAQWYPQSGSRAEMKRYRDCRNGIRVTFKKHRALLSRAIRARYCALVVLGKRGYRFVSRVVELLRGRRRQFA